MTRIMREIQFDAGHRLVGHESKCAHLHGHRYRAEIHVEAEKLDQVGRVIDFGVIKSLVGKWIDDKWDHNMLLNTFDPIFELPKKAQMVLFKDKEPYLFDSNPTAENIAEELYRQSRFLLNQYDLKVVKIVIWETPNCCAVYP